MKSRLSVSTLDRAIAELVEHGAILVQPRKNIKGDWTSNLYTVLTFPKGVSPPTRTPLIARDGTRLIAGAKELKPLELNPITLAHIRKEIWKKTKGLRWVLQSH